MENRDRPSVRLLISCPDTTGIVAAVAGFLAERGANIVSSDQHTTDPWAGRYLMRMEFVLDPDGPDLQRVRGDFAERVGGPFGMQWRMAPSLPLPRVAVLVSREEHCLLDLLGAGAGAASPARSRSWPPTTRTLRPTWPRFGVPFHHVPVPRGRQGLGRGPAARAAGRRRHRSGRPGPLHADPVARLPGPSGRAGGEYPPLVPARLRRRRPLPAARWSAGSS